MRHTAPRPSRAASLLAVACAVLLALVTSVAHAQDAPDPLTVGVPRGRCPVFYTDEDTGEIVGIGVDLMEAVCEAAGYDATFAYITEPTLKEALDDEAYDVVMPFGSAVPSAAGNPTLVTDNLIQTPFTLVTRGTENLPPIGELHIGMLSSLAAGAETVTELYPDVTITLFDNMDACVQALRRGDVDALLHNSYVWSYVLEKPAYDDLTVHPASMFSMDFRAGTTDTESGRAMVARLDEGIATLSDTRRQAIVLDYTTRRLYHYDLADYVHLYGFVVVLAALLAAVLAVVAARRWRSLRRAQEERMRELIDHDALTGTLSLEGFRKRAAELIRTHPFTPYLMSYVNIRNFKYINDDLGKQAGDDLLRFFATRTLEVLDDEVEAVGRAAADHFYVLRKSGGEGQLAHDERDVMGATRSFFVDRGLDRRVQICSGIYVLTPDDYVEVDVDRMIDYARVAQQWARDRHNDGYAFYNPRQWERGKIVADVVTQLPQAVAAGDIKVFYQPQVDYATGRIVGAEALCRWQHASLGWLSPADFIPILEEAGLMYDLDRFVWDTACQDLRRWCDQGLDQVVSVNLSRLDVGEDQEVARHLLELVSSHGIAPGLVNVEITESAFVENPAELIRATTELQGLGFQVEMDDFGSGYSSLHMLKEVPVDRIKLDLHFLSGSGDPERGRTIVRHVLAMISDLGLAVIAEGVETKEQARFLAHEGCMEMQGFHFFRPMPRDDFERLLAEHASGACPEDASEEPPTPA